MQVSDLTMFGYFSIGFIDFMFEGINVTDLRNSFLPNNLKDNDKVILNYVYLKKYIKWLKHLIMQL